MPLGASPTPESSSHSPTLHGSPLPLLRASALRLHPLLPPQGASVYQPLSLRGGVPRRSLRAGNARVTPHSLEPRVQVQGADWAVLPPTLNSEQSVAPGEEHLLMPSAHFCPCRRRKVSGTRGRAPAVLLPNRVRPPQVLLRQGSWARTRFLAAPRRGEALFVYGVNSSAACALLQPPRET